MRSLSVRRMLLACALSAAMAAALVGSSAASASLNTQCSGVNITGQGANVAKIAQQTVWDPSFNTSTSKSACSGTQGSKGKPIVSYTTSSAATGLESWGANKHVGTNFSSTNAFIGASEPPNATQKEEIESFETTLVPQALESIPTFQTAIAVIVNLPSNCVATSKKNKGRLELNNVTLEGIFRGTISKWSQIKEDGDTLSGAGCNAESSIIPVVRLDGAGTTHIFKRYLGLISNGTFQDEKEANQTWKGTSEGLLNTDWPKAANVTRPAKSGDTAIDTKVAETPGSISYTTFAEARANGSFTPSPGAGGPNTARFWAPLQDNGVVTTKQKFADPSSDGDVATLGDSNCKSTEYTDGEVAFPPASVLEPWDQVTTRTTEKKYTLCSIVVELAFTSYSAFPGTSLEEATTVGDFFHFVTDAKAGGGQKLIAGHDYLALPVGAVLNEAQKGAEKIGF
jgi:ABC-type phosphate transport system substrate-binding protein